MIKPTQIIFVLALAAAGVLADINEDFATITPSGGAAWDGIGDNGQVWYGDTNQLQSGQSTTSANSDGTSVFCRNPASTDAENTAPENNVNNGTGVRDDETGTITTVTSMGNIPPGYSVLWSGHIGEDNNQSLGISGSSWGGLILTADTNDATVIETGHANALRLVLLNEGSGDRAVLQQSTGSGTWVSLASDTTGDGGGNLRSATLTATLKGSVLSFSAQPINENTTWDGFFDFAGSLPSLGEFTGFIMNENSNDRGVRFDSLSVIYLIAARNDYYDLPFGDTNITVSASEGVLANDINGAAAVLVTNAVNGYVTLNSDGGFIYTANPGFEGTDTFTYYVENGAETSTPATVTLTVQLSGHELLPFPVSTGQRGTVTCLDNPSINYDIYLPPAYSRVGTPLPILYTFHPNGGGHVSDFKNVCSSLNVIVVGVIGSKNNLGWDIVLEECYAVSHDIRSRVLFDPTAEFAAGFSGGGLVSYMYSRIRSQHVAGVFQMAGWLGRVSTYQTTDRVQTNLLVARSMGLSDSASWVMAPDAAYLSQWNAVIQDWYFEGAHQVAPDSVKTSALSWLINERIQAAPEDRTNAFTQAQAWRTAIDEGRAEEVIRECVTVLMSNPRSWSAYEAQWVIDDLMADDEAFRSLSLSSLALGDFASDLFYYDAFGAALNSGMARYCSCLKALTGIDDTNGDRAGDIYALLQRFGYPEPQLQYSTDTALDRITIWLAKDTPGLTYTNQVSTNLLSDAWLNMPDSSTESNTSWLASFDLNPAFSNAFYQVETTAVPATSPPWPGQ